MSSNVLRPKRRFVPLPFIHQRQRAEPALLQLAFKSFDQQTRLIGSQLLLVRGKDHYIIPKGTQRPLPSPAGADVTAFPREWVKWQRSKGDPKNPRPLPIDNSPFLCEHQKVLIDIKSEVDNPVKIDVTSEKDWKSLQKRYVRSCLLMPKR